MSYTTAKAAIIAGVTALVPTTTTRGQGKRYTLVNRSVWSQDPDVVSSLPDRAYNLVAVTHQRIGHAGTAATVYRTTFGLAVHHEPGASVNDDDERMGEDWEQLAALIDSVVTLGGGIESLVSDGDTRATGVQTPDTLAMTFTVRHS